MIDVPATMIPDFNMQFEVITNAYDYALRARIIQQVKPVAYATHILCSANNTTKKMLAVVCALKFLCCYLEGTNFTVLKYYTFVLKPLLSRRQVR